MPAENGLKILVAVTCAMVIARGRKMEMPQYLIEYAVACTGVVLIFMISEKIR